MKLERLTQAAVTKAEKGGQVQGWYTLCAKGYSPKEIALYTTAWHSELAFKVREYSRLHGLSEPATCKKVREYVRRKPQVVDCRAAFRASVMRTGLALVLTQPMLELLCARAAGVRWDRSLYFREHGQAKADCVIATTAALEKRGLIECGTTSLTPIGHLVVGLLKEVGVFQVADEALAR